MKTWFLVGMMVHSSGVYVEDYRLERFGSLEECKAVQAYLAERVKPPAKKGTLKGGLEWQGCFDADQLKKLAAEHKEKRLEMEEDLKKWMGRE